MALLAPFATDALSDSLYKGADYLNPNDTSFFAVGCWISQHVAAQLETGRMHSMFVGASYSCGTFDRP